MSAYNPDNIFTLYQQQAALWLAVEAGVAAGARSPVGQQPLQEGAQGMVTSELPISIST